MISKIFRSVFLSTVIVLLISIASSLVISSYLMAKTDSEAMTEFANKLAAKINDNQEIDLSFLGIDTYRINLISSSENPFSTKSFSESLPISISNFFRFLITSRSKVVNIRVRQISCATEFCFSTRRFVFINQSL